MHTTPISPNKVSSFLRSVAGIRKNQRAGVQLTRPSTANCVEAQATPTQRHTGSARQTEYAQQTETAAIDFSGRTGRVTYRKPSKTQSQASSDSLANPNYERAVIGDGTQRLPGVLDDSREYHLATSPTIEIETSHGYHEIIPATKKVIPAYEVVPPLAPRVPLSSQPGSRRQSPSKHRSNASQGSLPNPAYAEFGGGRGLSGSARHSPTRQRENDTSQGSLPNPAYDFLGQEPQSKDSAVSTACGDGVARRFSTLSQESFRNPTYNSAGPRRSDTVAVSSNYSTTLQPGSEEDHEVHKTQPAYIEVKSPEKSPPLGDKSERNRLSEQRESCRSLENPAYWIKRSPTSENVGHPGAQAQYEEINITDSERGDQRLSEVSIELRNPAYEMTSLQGTRSPDSGGTTLLTPPGGSSNVHKSEQNAASHASETDSRAMETDALPTRSSGREPAALHVHEAHMETSQGGSQSTEQCALTDNPSYLDISQEAVEVDEYIAVV